ncbi:MAG: diphthine--ammonia ligase [Nitrososphaerales archaeon]
MDERTIAVLYSGGKDSTYVCSKLMDQGYKIACLITLDSENKESYMLHSVNINLTKLCSEALGIPLFLGKTKGEKEIELEDISRTISEAKARFNFAGIATGAISSEYQRRRIDAIGRECETAVLSPLWGVNQADYIDTIVNEGYRFILTSVSCQGLDESWLGKEVSEIAAKRLRLLSTKYKFNIAFEGGEAETLVLDCPLFRKTIRIVDSTAHWNGYFGSLEIKEAILEDKMISRPLI